MAETNQAVAEMWALFERHRESLACADREDLDQFDQAFCELACRYLGHTLGPDQCNMPEHDFCYRCQQMASSLGFKRHADWPHNRSYVLSTKE